MKSVRTAENIIEGLRGGLIVSCQALEGEPLYRTEGGIMPLMAKAAVAGGAVGIRANGLRDIREIQAAVEVPLIGIVKQDYPDTDLYITVSMKEVDALVHAGVEIIALDATDRPRPGGQSAAQFIADIRAQYGDILLMADIATYEEGINAAAAGADFVGTTMSGYTPATQAVKALDLELIARLARDLPVPLIAEGRVETPELARRCIELGAFAVVVGGAITRPQSISRRFAEAIQKAHS